MARQNPEKGLWWEGAACAISESGKIEGEGEGGEAIVTTDRGVSEKSEMKFLKLKKDKVARN